MQVTTLEPGNPAQAEAAAREAASVLADGGRVVFPTETVYGLAAAVSSDDAVATLRELKGDPAASFSLHLPSPLDAGNYLPNPTLRTRRLVQKLLAGPVTLRLTVGEDEAAALLDGLGVAPEHRDRVYGKGYLSLRCPDHVITRRMLNAVDRPVIAAAACPRGVTSPHTADEALAAIGDRADYVIDGGPSRYAKPSTAVRLTMVNGSPVVRVEREGLYDQRTIDRLSRFTILFVCSGNTCRSPMAEGLAKHKLAAARGIRADELEAAGFRVISAGVFAASGMSASPEGVIALGKRGIDLSGHRSAPLTRQLIDEADLILGLTEAHVRAIVELSPSAAERVLRLDPDGDVADPIGTDVASYERTADAIAAALDRRLKELGP